MPWDDALYDKTFAQYEKWLDLERCSQVSAFCCAVLLICVHYSLGSALDPVRYLLAGAGIASVCGYVLGFKMRGHYGGLLDQQLFALRDPKPADLPTP